MAVVINGSGTVTGLAVGGLPDGTVDAGTLATDSVTAVKIPDTVEADLKSGRKNLIINGGMQVAQRGTSGFSTHNAYTLDRWKAYDNSTSGSFTVSQDTDAPANFKNSLKFLVGTAGTTTTSSVTNIRYFVEGNDFAHLNFGTSDAQTYTVSFWVKSSVTGTYCLGTLNNDNNRAIAKEYTINTANTWEYKTITIASDTSGTYLTTNGTGIQLIWDLGSDSAFDQTADTYSSTVGFKTSNQTAFIGNAGATFYITGVQLELGSTATDFEHRSYGEELALCKRYYEKSFEYETTPANGASTTTFLTNNGIVSVSPVLWHNNNMHTVKYEVEKRIVPTVTRYGNSQGYWGYINVGSSPTGSDNSHDFHQHLFCLHNCTKTFVVTNQVSGNPLWGARGHWTADAEL